LPTILFSQNKLKRRRSEKALPTNSAVPKQQTVLSRATMDQYRFISITILLTLILDTIQREYSFNYLRKDNFILAFANEGQTYNTLQYSLTAFSPYPEFGFKAKHFNFLKEPNKI
jgi:hypothetical protein